MGFLSKADTRVVLPQETTMEGSGTVWEDLVLLLLAGVAPVEGGSVWPWEWGLPVPSVGVPCAASPDFSAPLPCSSVCMNARHGAVLKDTRQLPASAWPAGQMLALLSCNVQRNSVFQPGLLGSEVLWSCIG